MRHRTTLLFKSIDLIDPESILISKNSLFLQSPKKFAKEERISIGLDELPQELNQLLTSSKELNIRWVTEKEFEIEVPLVSRLSPGLHIFYTPQTDTKSLTTLCSIVEKAFGGVDCTNPERSFTSRKDEKFSNLSYNYHTLLPSISNFVEHLIYKACPLLLPSLSEYCREYATTLANASTLDISFNIKTNSLVLSYFRPVKTESFSASIPTELRSQYNIRREIGLLAPLSSPELYPSIKPGETSFAGFLSVISEDGDLKPTIFSFPSRHHSSDAKFRAYFLENCGLHPILELKVTDAEVPVENQDCGLYVYLILPRSLFIDKHQFSDPLFLSDKNIAGLQYIDENIDLEAPEYNVYSWGSSALMRLVQPVITQDLGTEWKAQIPTHLRYLLPSSNTSGFRYLENPYPVMFWACTPKEKPEFSVNPFDRTYLGYDDLFAPDTVFYHLSSKAAQTDGRLVNRLKVPVLDIDNSRWVENFTLIAVALGFAWIFWCLLKVLIGQGYKANMKKTNCKEKKIK
ncbi:Protein pbn1 [Golovinomyces cichoracearum]|uniref:Protein PBN1 n=1 Tax=Golovinomyces cichoracearum TaxID=62708 RepID=A0A420IC60_9PEZI|nr:Protein pbn1 [Golovinomyces cichoracearum]